MTRKLKTLALAFALLASLGMLGGALLAPEPAEAACLPVCDGGWCPPGKVSARDHCTGAHVCVNFCAF